MQRFVVQLIILRYYFPLEIFPFISKTSVTSPARHPDYQRYSMASLQQALSGADGADVARRQRIEAEIAQRQQDDHAAEQRQWAARPQDKPLDPATAALEEAAGPFLRSAGYVLLFAWLVLRVAGLLETLQTGIRSFVFANLGVLIFGVCLARGKLRAAVWLRWLAVFWIVPTVLALDFLLLQPLSLTVTQFKLAPGYRIWSVLEAALSLWVIYYLHRQLGMPAVVAACDTRGYKRRDLRIPAIFGLILGMAGVAFQLHASHGDVARQARTIVAQRYGSGYAYHVSGVGQSVTPQGRLHTALVQVWDDKGLMQVPVQWPQ